MDPVTNVVYVLATNETWQQTYTHGYIFLVVGVPCGMTLGVLGRIIRWWRKAADSSS